MMAAPGFNITKGMSPRALLAVIALILLVAAVLFIVILQGRPDGVDLLGFSAESTATVSYAGEFPAEGEPKLLNPLGIAARGTTLYVAESDAGRIRVFGLNGQDFGFIQLPVAEGAPAVYPSDIATLGADRLVVVDNSGARVIVIGADPEKETIVHSRIGEDDPGTAPVQPTAVAVAGDVIYVADGATRAISSYGADGEFLRVLVEGIEGAGMLAGGLSVKGDTLYVTDSNSGTVARFDLETGKPLGVFPESFALPRGVAAGLGDGLLVVDTFERTVRLTDAAGRRVDAIDGSADGATALASPRGVCWIASASRAYITDAERGRVVVFNMRTLN